MVSLYWEVIVYIAESVKWSGPELVCGGRWMCFVSSACNEDQYSSVPTRAAASQ